MKDDGLQGDVSINKHVKLKTELTKVEPAMLTHIAVPGVWRVVLTFCVTERARTSFSFKNANSWKGLELKCGFEEGRWQHVLVSEHRCQPSEHYSLHTIKGTSLDARLYPLVPNTPLAGYYYDDEHIHDGQEEAETPEFNDCSRIMLQCAGFHCGSEECRLKKKKGCHFHSGVRFAAALRLRHATHRQSPQVKPVWENPLD